MSYSRIRIYPPNPNGARGSSTKVDSHGDRIIYANGKSIIIRDLANSLNDTVYSGHILPTTAARISPTGYYAASADVAGNVRIWDIVGSDQVLKSEFKVLGGKINDLAWDGESKRIIAVGDGREKFGHVFQFDTGSSAGEIQGHSKALNAVAIRHHRPFRAATAGDDGLIVFHTGTPYKYSCTRKLHTNFIHSISYAPSGSHFISTGSDSKVFIWDGQTGEHVAEFANGHKGSVFAGAWSPDSTRIASSSADGTVKLWDVETHQPTTTYSLGSCVDFHQVGNTWTSKGVVVSISLDGVVNVFDPRDGSGPVQTLHGPQKGITSTTIVTRPSTFFTGSGDGRIHCLSLADDHAPLTRISGTGHSTLVSGLACTPTGSVWSVGFDDCLREVDVDGAKFTPSFTKTASQPNRACASYQDAHIFIAEANHLEVVKSSQKVASLSTTGAENLCIDVHDSLVAVGGKDAKVRLYSWKLDGKLAEMGLLEGPYKGEVSALKFSGDGKMLAVGDSSGKILVFNMTDRSVKINRWTFHTSRIYSLAWTEDNAHVASASLDTNIYVWSITKPLKYIAIKNAIPGGAVGVQWAPIPEDGDPKGKRKLLGAGTDAVVRMWEITFHAN